jgi:hypothetical protein
VRLDEVDRHDVEVRETGSSRFLQKPIALLVLSHAATGLDKISRYFQPMRAN